MIECVIKKIIPEAQYGGTTYTQTAICQLQNGQEITVFDTTVPILNSEITGSPAMIELLGLVTEYELGEQTAGIKELNEGEYEYSGEIIETATVGESCTETVCIDIGIGTIHIERDALEHSIGDFDSIIGNSISVRTYRTDIVAYHEK